MKILHIVSNFVIMRAAVCSMLNIFREVDCSCDRDVIGGGLRIFKPHPVRCKSYYAEDVMCG